MTVKRRVAFPVLVAACLAAVLSVVVSAARGEVKAEIKDIMNSVNNGPASFFGHLKEDFSKPSLEEEEGAAQKGRAAMMVEAGNMLLGMKPPKGAADEAGLATWKKHVNDYRGCAEAVYDAAVKKDLAAGKAAVLALGKRCAECHKDHQPEE